MEDLTNVTFLEPADGVRCIKDGGCSECEHNQTCEHPANWCRPMPDGSDLGKLLKWVERAAKQSLLYNLPEKAREGWPDAIKRAMAAEAEVGRANTLLLQVHHAILGGNADAMKGAVRDYLKAALKVGDPT
jgi:hypothetical protein